MKKKPASRNLLYISQDVTKTPPWTRSFADIALRGLLRLHLDYLLWSTPQDFEAEQYQSQLLIGPGVAYADEVTVCAAITQEFLSSRSVFGGWIPGEASVNIGNGARYYIVRREYEYPKSRSRADIVVTRINEENRSEQGETTTDAKTIADKQYKPVYIEAKRAYVSPTKLEQKSQKPKSQLGGIRRDIKKLRDRYDTSFRGYVLVWNIVSGDTNVWPENFFKKLANEHAIVLWQARAAPLVDIADTAKVAANKELLPSRWIWLALAEVTKIEDYEKMRPEGYSYTGLK